MEDGAVVADGPADGGVGGRTEIRDADEGVASWAEVVAGVAVPLDAGAGPGWGQGCPADVVAALTPGDPGRCPFATRGQNQPWRWEMDPAAVVVGGPASGLFDCQVQPRVDQLQQPSTYGRQVVGRAGGWKQRPWSR